MLYEVAPSTRPEIQMPILPTTTTYGWGWHGTKVLGTICASTTPSYQRRYCCLTFAKMLRIDWLDVVNDARLVTGASNRGDIYVLPTRKTALLLLLGKRRGLESSGKRKIILGASPGVNYQKRLLGERSSPFLSKGKWLGCSIKQIDSDTQYICRFQSF
jgi:hypothetical protein